MESSRKSEDRKEGCLSQSKLKNKMLQTKQLENVWKPEDGGHMKSFSKP